MTSHIGLIPVATVTHTEPFHVSKAIATLDFVSHGRAGWQVRVSGTAHEAELFGRRDVVGADLFDEASDAVEVVRRLWDSWEDDAVIRDVATGRFVDRDKLHYIDFAGKYFSVKGPSITPRSPQGQPVVAALAHALPIYEFASRSADLVFITPQDDDSLRTILGEVAQAAGRLKVYADVYVTFDGTADPRSDALVFDGTPTELVDLLLRWQQSGIDGVRLRPAVNATDLPVIVDEVVPLLQQAGRFRTAYTDGETLRERLGLPIAENRYARVEPLMNVPLSILDLAPISEGCDAATALRNTVDLAQHAEQWGYKRYWVAEHHFVAVASSQPAVLIGQIAAATERIRVGAAAVQLGQTTAVAVVESFGMLEAFHPGRIDLGVGRSGQRRREAIKDGEAKPKKPKPPTEWRDVDGVDRPAAVRHQRADAKPDDCARRCRSCNSPRPCHPTSASRSTDILAMLDGSYRIGDVDAHAVPGEGAGLTPWVFGSSKGQSAQVAGANGLPFVASYHITPATALDAIDAYRTAFRPSAALAQPYVVVSADVVVADDTDTARHLASSYGHWVYSIRAGDGAIPYPNPDTVDPLTDEQLAVGKGPYRNTIRR